jgi:hypothetical protein
LRDRGRARFCDLAGTAGLATVDLIGACSAPDHQWFHGHRPVGATPVWAQGTPSTGAEAQSTCKRLRLAASAFLLLRACDGERAGIAHVVSGGRDPAVAALDVCDVELADVAVEGIGDAAQILSPGEQPPERG